MSAPLNNLVNITFAGVAMRFQIADESDHIQRILSSGQLYECDLLADIFARRLPRGIIIDVGANIGNHTIFFAKTLRRYVIAIEPFPQAFKLLAQNVGLNNLSSRVTLIAAAAGQRRGSASIESPPPGNWGRSRITSAVDGAIELLALDQLNIRKRVCLIKIDVEGMEDDVLRGAQRLIKRDRPLLYVEAQTLSQQALIARRLRRHGYELLRRFNHTPTYLFAHCQSRADRIEAVLEKSKSLLHVGDIALGQRQMQRSLSEEIQRCTKCVFELTARVAAQENAVAIAAREAASDAVRQLAPEHQATRQLVTDLVASLRAAQESHERHIGEVVTNLQELILRERTSLRASETRRSSLRPRRLAMQERARPSRDDLLVLPLPVAAGQVAIHLPTHSVRGSREAPRQTSTSVWAPVAPEGANGSNSKLSTLISVVMTTYNGAAFAADAVRNVLAQSHRNLELIVVDDASTDGTFDVLQAIAREDARVRPVKMFDNRGTYWCKNFGLTVATGRYATFQDSDDRSDCSRLERQLRELRSTGAVVCTCNYVRVDANNQIVSNRGLRERKALMALLFDRSAVLREAGYFDSVRTSADDEFTHRLGIVFGHERICHVDEPLYRATVREGSLTMSDRNKADLNKGDGSSSDLSFLSAPRREYVRQYSAWHERLKQRKGNPVVSFPQLRRDFPAPTMLLPRPAGRECHVTASMASMPSREPLLRQTVASMLPQVDALNVYLNGYESTPSWIIHDKVQVIHSRDFGDLRDNGKFFFLDALLHGYHFTIDDDIVYPPDYVQKCVLKIEQYRRQAIVGVHGVILANPFVRFMQGRTVSHFKRGTSRDAFVNLLGTGTTAYHTDTLGLSFADFPQPGMADVWLAIAAKRQRVPMVAIARPDQWLKPLAEADDDSLYSAAQRDDQVQTQAILKYGPWSLDGLSADFPLCRALATEFSSDELKSRDVDSDALKTGCLPGPTNNANAHGNSSEFVLRNLHPVAVGNEAPHG